MAQALPTPLAHPAALPEVRYIPDFITDEEAAALTQHVYAAPRPKWTVLRNRRLQNWGGAPSSRGLIAEALPAWLRAVTERVDQLGVFGEGVCANHVLINEYLPGQGIMPHEDGPIYTPMIANITVGSHTVLDFYRKAEPDSKTSAAEPAPFASILLEPNSLVLISGDMYRVLHGIEERASDVLQEKTIINLDQCKSVAGTAPDGELPRETRLSFTIRYVPKVIKLSAALQSRLFGGKRP
eukprot:m.287181 g.287181  ORF g.287181 m.287181 type:complete len:240 (-) comp11726_c0_seq1:1236-1955(-)